MSIHSIKRVYLLGLLFLTAAFDAKGSVPLTSVYETLTAIYQVASKPDNASILASQLTILQEACAALKLAAAQGNSAGEATFDRELLKLALQEATVCLELIKENMTTQDAQLYANIIELAVQELATIQGAA